MRKERGKNRVNFSEKVTRQKAGQGRNKGKPFNFLI